MTHSTKTPPRALPPNTFPPERIDVDEFHLRRYTLADVESMHEAIKASFAEIHPWMPWCVEPVKIEDQREFVEGTFPKWMTGEAFNYAIFDSDEAETQAQARTRTQAQPRTRTQIGALSLMDRLGPGGLEIGYWLRTDATGRGVMTRAVGRLTEVGLALPGIERIEIHCDEANVRSAAVPRRLGYRLDRIEDDTVEAPGDTGRSMFWITP
jgi:RimJ/RimL family protein N-acetyltransferase